MGVSHGHLVFGNDGRGICHRRARSIECDRGDQQHAYQHADQLGRKRSQMQAVLENGNRGKPAERSPQGAAAAEHRRAAEDHRRDRIELVASRGVGARLAEVRDIHDRGDARDEARQQVGESNPARDRNAGVSRPRGREADCVPRPADDGAMQQHNVGGKDRREQRHLHRQNAADIALTQPQDRRREAGVVHRAVGDPLGEAAEQRQRAERDDQRRNAERRNQRRVQRAAGASGGQGHGRRGGRRPSPVARGGAEHHRGEPHHRADGQIDAAGDDDRRHRHRQQADFHAQPHHLERVRDGQKTRRDKRKDGDLDRDRNEQRAARHRRPRPFGPRA